MNPLLAWLLGEGIDVGAEKTGLKDRARGILSDLADAVIPEAAAADASAIPQQNRDISVRQGFDPIINEVPADRVLTQEEEQLITPKVRLPDGRVQMPTITMQEPTSPAMVDVTDQKQVDDVQNFVRSVGGRTKALMQEVPENADPKGAAALATVEGLVAKGMEPEPMDLGAPVQFGPTDVAIGQYPDGKPQSKEPDFFDKAGGFLTDLFGDEERMTRMALAFNSMRLQPDQGLATVLGKRLETLGTSRKANATARALRAKGTPAAIAAADYIEQTGDAKGGLKMAMEADQYVTGSGKEIMDTYGITGLVPSQPYRYNKTTKKVEGVGGGATNVFAVKPDKGYMLVTDETTGGVKQIPIPGSAAQERLAEVESSKQSMTGIISNSANKIRNVMSGGLLPETGTVSNLLGYIGETDAAEVRRQVNVLKSQAQVETLNAMRRQSPTGGALGSVTERELSMLSAKAGALDPSADSETFKAALDDYQRTLYEIVHGYDAGRKLFAEEMAQYGQSTAPATSGKIKRYNPATGRVE